MSTGVVSTSRVVKRLVVHGKVESSGTAGRKGCLFDVYLKVGATAINSARSDAQCSVFCSSLFRETSLPTK